MAFAPPPHAQRKRAPSGGRTPSRATRAPSPTKSSRATLRRDSSSRRGGGRAESSRSGRPGGEAPAVPPPHCWLTGMPVPRFGWPGLPEALRTATGAALNYVTLCPAAATALSDPSLPPGEVRAVCGERLAAEGCDERVTPRSDPFVAFLSKYTALLFAAAEERAAMLQDLPEEARNCLDLGTLRRLLNCANAAMAKPGLAAEEKALMRLEIANLHEQVQINHTYPAQSEQQSGAAASGPPVLAASSANPDSGSCVGGPLPAAEREQRLQTPSPNDPVDPPRVRGPPESCSGALICAAATQTHAAVPPSDVDGPGGAGLRQEIATLQAANAEALRHLAQLTRQYRDLAAAHQMCIRENDALVRERNALLREVGEWRKRPLAGPPQPGSPGARAGPRGASTERGGHGALGYANTAKAAEDARRIAAENETARLRLLNAELMERLRAAERHAAACRAQGPVVAARDYSTAVDELSRAHEARCHAEQDASALQLLNQRLEQEVSQLRRDAAVGALPAAPAPRSGAAQQGPAAQPIAAAARPEGSPSRYPAGAALLAQLRSAQRPVDMRAVSPRLPSPGRVGMTSPLGDIDPAWPEAV
eukprot:TRINITY_DN47701_c0_g1_i1.p1 TRINITY_DN47701_c0_g1~~TRINITY_DN47701_c0_g1_i1.p1  ORF type:complete len:620 (+),score=156.33 TRINITY_DN47701_c0_g1_i1:81-1862(+)